MNDYPRTLKLLRLIESEISAQTKLRNHLLDLTQEGDSENSEMISLWLDTVNCRLETLNHLSEWSQKDMGDFEANCRHNIAVALAGLTPEAKDRVLSNVKTLIHRLDG